jgi:hypothetical protein
MTLMMFNDKHEFHVYLISKAAGFEGGALHANQ